MSSSATPHGAITTGTIVGSAFSNKVTHYKIKNAYGTSIFYGDFVKWGDDNPNTTVQKDTGTTACTPMEFFLDVLIPTLLLVNLRLINISQLQLLRMILVRMFVPIPL